VPRVLTINPPDEVLMKLADGRSIRTFSESRGMATFRATIGLKKI
jgi:hypothetical protein